MNSKLFLLSFVVMFTVMSRCPLCEAQAIEISQDLIREDDIVLHENEDYIHLKRGRTDLLVHTEQNILAELFEPSQKIQFA